VTTASGLGTEPRSGGIQFAPHRSIEHFFAHLTNHQDCAVPRVQLHRFPENQLPFLATNTRRGTTTRRAGSGNVLPSGPPARRRLWKSPALCHCEHVDEDSKASFFCLVLERRSMIYPQHISHIVWKILIRILNLLRFCVRKITQAMFAGFFVRGEQVQTIYSPTLYWNIPRYVVRTRLISISPSQKS
jgi:hypothetical protein